MGASTGRPRSTSAGALLSLERQDASCTRNGEHPNALTKQRCPIRDLVPRLELLDPSVPRTPSHKPCSWVSLKPSLPKIRALCIPVCSTSD
jgi:hypothetical protein